jgi:hypothetical protein
MNNWLGIDMGSQDATMMVWIKRQNQAHIERAEAAAAAAQDEGMRNFLIERERTRIRRAEMRTAAFGIEFNQALAERMGWLLTPKCKPPPGVLDWMPPNE